MPMVLVHRHNPTPIWEVRALLAGGKHLLVVPLFGAAHKRKIYRVRKTALRDSGYYPVEIENAVLAKLQT